jgi:hypothetical protein
MLKTGEDFQNRSLLLLLSAVTEKRRLPNMTNQKMVEIVA